MKDHLDELRNTPAQPLYDRVYQLLRQNIISGKYNVGERLTEEEISQTAGISRTPVREAFKRLAAEGLIEIIPQKGAVVMRFDDEEIETLWDFRIFIETKAASLAAQKAGIEDIIQLEKLVHQLELVREHPDLLDATTLLDNFNMEIINIAGVNQLSRLYKSVEFIIWDTLHTVFHDQQLLAEDPYSEHIEIARAVIEHNAPLAAQLTEKHLLKWKERYLTYYRANSKRR